MRSVVLWLCACASGCDLVIQLEPPPETACGHFDPPAEVAFSSALPPLAGFSPVGERALAHTVDVPPRVMSLKLDGAEWVADPMYQTALDKLRSSQNLHYAQLSFEGKMFGGIRDNVIADYKVQLYRYVPVGMNPPDTWVLDDNFPIAFTSGTSIYPGGSLTTGTAGSADEYKYHATRQITGEEGRLIVVVDTAQTMQWMTEAVSGLPTTAPINAEHDVSQASIALAPNGRPALVYAAKPRGGSGSSDLYVSQKRDGAWQVGVPVTGLSEDGADELDPYVNQDCSVLYFRRGEKIFQARARGR